MLVEELTSAGASRCVGKVDTVLIPVGTIEAHGPHCSVATDVLIPEKFFQLGSRRI
jgi:creatinine amidohydrolase